MNSMRFGLVSLLLPKSHGGLRTLRRLQSFHQAHKQFCRHLEICARVAFWVIAFGLPVYSLPVNHLAFGDGRTTRVGHQEVQLCDAAHLGRMVNTAGPGEMPKLIKYDASMGDLDHGDPSIVWCGLLPRGYAAYWPNVVVMIVFTVYKNTGATVKLAWQGIMGTLCATLNLRLMMYLFPSGARGHLCNDVENQHRLCAEGTMVYDDPNYSEALCWLNVFVLLFLFLISNAEMNTIKFGMSWHVYFMMSFLDPSHGPNRGVIPTGIPSVNWDDEGTIVNLTSIVGAMLAVLATLIPYPLLNITLVHENACGMCQASRSLLTDSMEYYCGARATERRHRIATRTQRLDDIVRSNISGNLQHAWWECFGLFGTGKRLALYSIFDGHIAKLVQVMYAITDSIFYENFDGSHARFVQHAKAAMEDLKDEGADLMEACARACEDGKISKEEFMDIRHKSSSVKDKQAALWTAYNSFVESELASSDLGSESLFVFALSVWARQITDFADDIGTMEQVADKHKLGLGARMLQIVIDGVRDTWCPRKMLDADHVQFCMRNFLSIAICFTLGYHLDGSVFTRYSFTMPGTLAVLISRFSGSAFQNNIRRLVAVSVGKVLPIFIFAAVGLAPSGSTQRFIIHAGALALYTFSFTYMYYMSLQWSSVGCWTAAFGLGSLLTITYTDPAQTFAARYMEIGQVTMAILVQMSVDALLSREAPRDLALGSLVKLTERMQHSYTAFFDGNVPLLAQNAAHAKTHHRTARDLVPDCNPNVEVVPGVRTAFKIELYADALNELRMLLSDVNILLLAISSWTSRNNEQVLPATVVELMLRPKALGIIRQDFDETIEAAMRMLCRLVGHSSEENVEFRRFYELETTNTIAELDGVDKFRNELNPLRLEDQASVCGSQEQEILSDPRVRLSVVLRVLRNSNLHLGNIIRLCLRARS